MSFLLRSRWVDIKNSLITYKFYFIIGLLFIVILTIFLSVNKTQTEEANKKTELKDNVTEQEKKISDNNNNVINNKNRPDALIQSEMKENLEDITFKDDLADYNGNFKKLEIRTYILKKNDSMAKIARQFNVNIDTILSFNNIKESKSIKIGMELVIPNYKGILHTVKPKETLRKIVNKYKVNLNDVVYVNGIIDNKINPGEKLFIPGARLPKEYFKIKKKYRSKKDKQKK